MLVLSSGVGFRITAKIQSDRKFENTVFGINLINSHGNIMLATSTRKYKESIPIEKGLTEISFDVDNIFTDDTYSINVALVDSDNGGDIIFQAPDVYRFDIKGIKESKHSLTHPLVKVEVNYEPKK